MGFDRFPVGRAEESSSGKFMGPVGEGRRLSCHDAGASRQPRESGSSLVTCHSSLLLGREIHAPQEVLAARVGTQGLFQLCVLRLSLLQDGDIGVGVFPEREEILIGGAGFGRVALQGVSARQSQPGQRTPGKVHH
jgi:hypothetical protein